MRVIGELRVRCIDTGELLSAMQGLERVSLSELQMTGALGKGATRYNVSFMPCFMYACWRHHRALPKACWVYVLIFGFW